MSKVAKSKEKPATKMEKPQNEPSSKTTKIKFEAILDFFFQGWYGKISAQPYTKLCIQFLNRENSDKNNTFPNFTAGTCIKKRKLCF